MKMCVIFTIMRPEETEVSRVEGLEQLDRARIISKKSDSISFVLASAEINRRKVNCKMGVPVNLKVLEKLGIRTFCG